MAIFITYMNYFYLKKKKKAKNPNETTTKKQRKEFKDCLGDQPFKAKDWHANWAPEVRQGGTWQAALVS